MKHRLKNALSLIECQTVDALVHQFLLLSFPRSQLSAIVVTLLNPPENKLDSWLIDLSHTVFKGQLDTNINDINHPLVQVVYRGIPTLWKDLSQGSYIDDVDFHQFIASLPPRCGLYGLPFHDNRRKICGAVTLIGVDLNETSHEQGIFPVYYSLFCHRLENILEVNQIKQQISQLQYILELEKEKENKIDSVITSLSSVTAISKEDALLDFNNINDLEAAIAHYEEAILLHRQQESADDFDEMAESLNLSKRALLYKLKKYGCLV